MARKRNADGAALQGSDEDEDPAAWGLLYDSYRITPEEHEKRAASVKGPSRCSRCGVLVIWSDVHRCPRRKAG